MTYLFLFTALLVAIYLLHTVNDNYIEVSKHTPNLTHDMVYAVLKSCSNYEKHYDRDVQFLLNSGLVTKADIEREADNLLFLWGEFPANQLEIDPRDFHRLVKVHSEMLQGANDLQIKYLVHTLY